MRGIPLALLAISSLLIPLRSTPTRAARPSARWSHNVQAAWNAARRTNRPLLLFITLDGCQYCRKMKAETLGNYSVLDRIEASYVAATIEASEAPKLMRTLHVRSYPTTVIVGPEGQVWGSVRGYVGPGEFRRRLDSLAARRLSRRAS